MLDLATLKADANAAAHEHARTFELLSDAELTQLAEDIRSNGLLHPILKDAAGRIIDGRNRFIACAMAGVAPTYEVVPPHVDILHTIISLNLHRRHLTTSQRAAIAADLANLKRGGVQPADLPDAVSQADAAAMTNVSERTVREACAVKAADPKLHTEMKTGAVKLAEASSRIRPKRDKNSAAHIRHIVELVQRHVSERAVGRLVLGDVRQLQAVLAPALAAVEQRIAALETTEASDVAE